jgi:hypothetical protein
MENLLSLTTDFSVHLSTYFFQTLTRVHSIIIHKTTTQIFITVNTLYLTRIRLFNLFWLKM